MLRPDQLSFEMVDEYFFFDPFTAKIFWKKNRGHIKAWQEAGSVDGSGYRHIMLFGAFYQASNIIWTLMTGEWPPIQIDHINRDRSDDRWENLRLATGPQNMHNQNLKTSNTSGYRGIYKDSKKWRAHLRCPDRIRRNSESCDTKEEAARRYDKMAREFYGEFANVNFP